MGAVKNLLLLTSLSGLISVPLVCFFETGEVLVEDFDGDTYRAVYTIKFADVVYVLHSFQKKSKQGIATPKQDMDLIEARLKRAKEHYSEHYNKK